jgi:hypothetical protein
MNAIHQIKIVIIVTIIILTNTIHVLSQNYLVKPLSDYLGPLELKHSNLIKSIEEKTSLSNSEKLNFYQNELNKLKEEFKIDRKAEYESKSVEMSVSHSCTSSSSGSSKNCGFKYVYAPNKDLYTRREWVTVKGTNKGITVAADGSNAGLKMTVAGKGRNSGTLTATFRYRPEEISNFLVVEIIELFKGFSFTSSSGNNPGGGNGTNSGFNLIIQNKSSNSETKFCTPITVNGFENIFRIKLSINYDKSMLDFVSVSNFGLPGLTEKGSFGVPGRGSTAGNITLNWLDEKLTGKSLTNGATLFDLCFFGKVNGTTTVEISNTPFKIEILDVTAKNIPFKGSAGFITISGNNKTIPTIETKEIRSIGSSKANSGGIITSNGGSDITSKGVIWSLNPNPTISLLSKTNQGSGNDSFNASLDGLNPNTTYYVRAYAVNSIGIGYGDVKNFKTISLPQLTTNPATSITAISAISGGNITSDGGSPITARGVVYSDKPKPEIKLTTKTIDGKGTGSFTSNLSNLSSNTTYYARTYATNKNGTTYGPEITFKTIELYKVWCNSNYPPGWIFFRNIDPSHWQSYCGKDYRGFINVAVQIINPAALPVGSFIDLCPSQGIPYGWKLINSIDYNCLWSGLNLNPTSTYRWWDCCYYWTSGFTWSYQRFYSRIQKVF